MAITISDTEPRVQYTATAGQVSFSVPFEFFDNADLVVIKTANNADTTLNYNSSPSTALQYSVSGAGQTGGGSISLGGSGATLNDKITIYRNLAIARSTDFPTSGAFQVESLNTELDKIIAMIQQNERDLKFSPKALATTSNTYNLTFPNLEANKVLTVNSSGDGLVFSADIGSYEGNWATATGYNLRDIVKQSSGSDSTTLNNIYICNTAHTSTGSYLTQNDTSNWTLLINVADAANAVVDAEAAQTAAEAAQAAAEIAQTAAELAETNAETAETNASASATAAANSYDSFDDRYLGAKASDPTLDNDSNALIDGALYFDTTLNAMKVYDLGTTSWKRTTPTSSEQSAIDTVSGISADVTTVAGQISPTNNIATLGALDSQLTNLGALGTEITNLNNIRTDITGVNNINSQVQTVAGLNTEITNLDSISADITAVANISGDIQDVQDKIAELQTVANDLNEVTSEIETVAGSINQIDAIGNDLLGANNIGTVATNIADVNSFANTYRIAASAPVTSLDVGDLYFDTTANELKVYKASGWSAAGSTVNGTAARFTYNITGTPSSVSGSDANGNTLAYDAGFADVYVNGVRMSSSDITITSGTSVVFASALADGDVVDVVAYGTFNVAAIDASNITSGSLNIARIADSSITNAKLANDSITINGTPTALGGSVSIVTTLTYSSGTATGDGSTTTATISSGRTVDDVLVFVNGFQLTPTTDYTISGTTLTFQTAPANNAEITFRYLPLGGAYTHANFTGDGSATTITIDAGRAVA
jgi:hypothetical protein